MKNNESEGRRGIAAGGSAEKNVIRVFGAHSGKTGGAGKAADAVSGREADAAGRGAEAKRDEASPTAVKEKRVGKKEKGKAAEALQKGKPEKRAKQRGERGGARQYLGSVIAVILIMLTAGACVGAYFLSLVKTISVTGCESYTPTRIINEAGLYTGKSIITYDTKKIADKLSEDPYIKVLSVKKVYPNEIRISVEERTEYAAIVTGTGTYCVIDRDGCILYTGRRQSIDGLLPVYGLGTIGFSTGSYINADKSLLRPYVLMELLEAIGVRDGEIASIDLSIPASLKIETTDGFTVMLGDSVDIAEKTERMFAALEKARQGSPKSTVIYINDSGSADISSGMPSKTPEPVSTPMNTDEPINNTEGADIGG